MQTYLQIVNLIAFAGENTNQVSDIPDFQLMPDTKNTTFERGQRTSG